jgi:uncharacterized membrane protein YagU involved in acid resistance
MGTRSSLACSQKPTIGPDPQPDESNPPTQFIQNIFLNYISSFKITSFFRIPHQNFVCISSFSYMLHVPLILSSLMSSRNNIWQEAQIFKFLMQNFLAFFIYKYSLQYPLLKYPPPLCSFPYASDLFSDPYKTTGKITILYVFLCGFRKQTNEKETFAFQKSDLS